MFQIRTILSETMRRVIQKDKPKTEIFEHMVKSFYKEHPKADKAVITIKEDKMTRSEKQNKLYWKWIGILSSETGYTKDAMHDIMRDKFLGYRTVKTKDKSIQALRSTTELKIEEMKDYLIDIDMFAIEFGIMLPRPEDLYFESMGYKREQNGHR